MSCTIVMLPLLAPALWPVVCAAAATVLTAAGFQQLEGRQTDSEEKESVESDLDEEMTSAISAALRLEGSISMEKDGVVVRVGKNARGKCTVHVSGSGKSKSELKKLGEDLSQQIIQKTVYEMVKRHADSKGYEVVEESQEADRTIRLTVRRWK